MYSPDTNWEKRLSKFFSGFADQQDLSGTHIRLAFSGGSDSVLTLYVLLALQKPLGYKHLEIWYLNHGQTFSQEDHLKREHILSTHRHFASRYADKVILTSEQFRDISKIAAKLGTSFERGGSLVRNRLLRHNLPSNGAIATGHSLSDWVETVFLRLNRGSGLSALMPFADVRQVDSVVYLHPLAKLASSEIKSLCNELKLPFWDDPSNEDKSIRRNHLRAALTYHPTGLRKSRDLFLVDRSIDKQFNFKTIKQGREYHFLLDDFKALSTNEQTSLLLQGLDLIGLKQVSKGLRTRLLKELIFSHKCFFVEKENWHNKLWLVFRRGRNTLVETFELPKGCVRGSTLTGKHHKISLSYGHKSIKKIFSEQKLSQRQRHNTIVLIDNHTSEILEIRLDLFGLKTIIASLKA